MIGFNSGFSSAAMHWLLYYVFVLCFLYSRCFNVGCGFFPCHNFRSFVLLSFCVLSRVTN